MSFLSVEHAIELSGGIPFADLWGVADIAGRGHTGYEGRNDQRKAMVAAALGAEELLSSFLAELLRYDLNNGDLFGSQSDPQMRGNDRQSNALRFIWSIQKSINHRRHANGLPPQEFRLDSTTIPANYDVTKLHLTDTGLSELAARLCGDKVRYWPEATKWLQWDGRRYVTDMPGGMYPVVKGVHQELLNIAVKVEDTDKRSGILKELIKIEGYYKQQTIIKAMEVIPSLIVTTSELDQDPMLLTCLNGTLDLITGTLRPHDPADRITRIVSVEYDHTAECPLFEAFLNRIFGRNQNMTNYIQRFFGYCLTGRTDEQTMCFFYGTGANGKTTLLKLFLLLMADFAASAQADLLMLRNDNGASNDLARLRGTRLVAVNEVNEGAKLDEAKLKTLTGGDTVTARFLFQEYFEYVPQFKLVLIGNHKPTIKGRDFGIWRRIHLIPFAVTIPPEERDPMLLEKLKGEVPGILAWAVRGCIEWQQGGLKAPEEVLAAVKEYRDSEDHFGSWLNDCCCRGENLWAKADDLLESFKRVTGMTHITSNKLTKMLKEEGFKNERKYAGQCWIGIGLKTSQ